MRRHGCCTLIDTHPPGLAMTGTHILTSTGAHIGSGHNDAGIDAVIAAREQRTR